MITLHAADAPGAAAHEASQFAHVLTANLLVASSTTADIADRLQALERVFYAWPALCRRMAALEAVAPRTAKLGQDQNATTRDWIEGRAS